MHRVPRPEEGDADGAHGQGEVRGVPRREVRQDAPRLEAGDHETGERHRRRARGGEGVRRPHEEGRTGRLERGDAGPAGGRELPGGLRRPWSPQPQAQQGDAPGGAGRHREGAYRQTEEVTAVNKNSPWGSPRGVFILWLVSRVGYFFP